MHLNFKSVNDSVDFHFNQKNEVFIFFIIRLHKISNKQAINKFKFF
jgi:hypothetical protein